MRPRRFRCSALVGKCEGLRTPAPGVRRATFMGPASANLHKGGNRGTSSNAERQALWGFRRGRSVVDVC
jgi:hypothetical protein